MSPSPGESTHRPHGIGELIHVVWEALPGAPHHLGLSCSAFPKITTRRTVNKHSTTHYKYCLVALFISRFFSVIFGQPCKWESKPNANQRSQTNMQAVILVLSLGNHQANVFSCLSDTSQTQNLARTKNLSLGFWPFPSLLLKYLFSFSFC